MKPVGTSYSIKVAYGQVAVRDTARVWWRALQMPDWVWLMMIFMASAALALTMMMRERTQLRAAQTSLTQTQQALIQVQGKNKQNKARLEGLRTSRQRAENIAQDELNYVRSNEVIVSMR